MKLHTGVAHDGVEAHSMLALDALLELGVTSSVILESAWPTWLMTHLTSKRLASRAMEI